METEIELERKYGVMVFGNEEATSDLCGVQAGDQGAKPKLSGGRGLISGIGGVETEVVVGGQVATAQKLG